MTDSIKKVSKAVAEREYQSGIEAEARAQWEKHDAVTRAKEVVFSGISRWVDTEVKSGDPIPVIREGRKVGELRQPNFGICLADRVASASLIEHKSEIKRKMSALKTLIEASDGLNEALRNVSHYDRASLNRKDWAKPVPDGGRAPLTARLIREIGCTDSAAIAATSISETAKAELVELREELENRETRPGRPRDEAAHAVARELALLYAKITGKKPTYGEGPDGLSGEYTPALRYIFDALGWQNTGLRGPATAAINAVTDADLAYEELRPLGLLSTGLIC